MKNIVTKTVNAVKRVNNKLISDSDKLYQSNKDKYHYLSI